MDAAVDCMEQFSNLLLPECRCIKSGKFSVGSSVPAAPLLNFDDRLRVEITGHRHFELENGSGFVVRGERIWMHTQLLDQHHVGGSVPAGAAGVGGRLCVRMAHRRDDTVGAAALPSGMLASIAKSMSENKKNPSEGAWNGWSALTGPHLPQRRRPV